MIVRPEICFTSFSSIIFQQKNIAPRRMAGHHQLFIKHLRGICKSRTHHQCPQLQTKNAILLKVIEEICLLFAFPNAKYEDTQKDFEEESLTDFRTAFSITPKRNYVLFTLEWCKSCKNKISQKATFLVWESLCI